MLSKDHHPLLQYFLKVLTLIACQSSETKLLEIGYSMHLEELQETELRCRSNETLLWKFHGERFTHWVKEKV